MTLPLLLLLALGVAMDNFAAAVSIGMSRPPKPLETSLVVSVVFGLFQTVLPALGWAAGAIVAPYLRAYSGPVVFVVLIIIAWRMLQAAFADEDEGAEPANFATILALGFITSVDSLALGFGLGVQQSDLALTCTAVGGVTAVLCFVGTLSGARFGDVLGRRSRLVGAVLLVALATRDLLVR